MTLWLHHKALYIAIKCPVFAPYFVQKRPLFCPSISPDSATYGKVDSMGTNERPGN